jgi:hypothetical protein
VLVEERVRHHLEHQSQQQPGIGQAGEGHARHGVQPSPVGPDQEVGGVTGDGTIDRVREGVCATYDRRANA